jgi:hypothetical protein
MKYEHFHGRFESIEPYNENFMRVSIRVFAFGKNNNMSNITQSAFEIAKPSIYNIPIVAKYNEDAVDTYGNDGDLEGHNTVLRKNSDGSWNIYQDTFPLGFLPSDAEITFEDVNEGTDEKPDIKTYVVAKGCLLWMRYDASKKIKEWLDNGIEPQVSMEIENVEGKFVDNVFKIDSFAFSAVAALGSSVQACFPKSQIQQYEEFDFQKAYKEMLKEFKEYSKSVQGGDSVPTEDVLDPVVEPVVEPVVDEPVTQFSLTSEQLRRELSIAVSQEKIKDEWDYEWSHYWYVDNDETNVIASDVQDHYRLVSFTYSMNGDNPVIDFDTRKRMKVQYVPMEDGEEGNFSLMPVEAAEYQAQLKVKSAEAKFTEEKQSLNAQIEDAKSAYTVLEQETQTLREYAQQKQTEEINRQKEELFAKYSSAQFTEDEIAEIKAQSDNMSIEELENSFVILAGKKVLAGKFSVVKESKALRIPVNDNQPEVKPYGGLVEKYVSR